VLTGTAAVHNAAWTRMFDDYLRARADRDGTPYVPFDPDNDYNSYVDGRPRADGVRTFLASRGITLPEGGRPTRPAGRPCTGWPTQERDAARPHPRARRPAVPGLGGLPAGGAAAGLRRAVVSASANAREVIAAAGLADLLEVCVDGIVAADQHLRGKPAPDTFLAAAAGLGVEIGQAAVFEDAVAGVAAGVSAKAGYVVGVDRVGHATALRAAGASIVVSDLSELMS
jgi:beta-phosphoglucomutase-like phosphatase (HAD superfamily)